MCKNKILVMVLIIFFLLNTSCNNNDVSYDENAINNEVINNDISNSEQINTNRNNQIINNEVVDSEISNNENELIDSSDEGDEKLDETVELSEEEYNKLLLENKVNELGQIMVLMYHNIADKPGDYATTVDLFKSELQTLYDKNYVTISMSDFVSGNIDIAIGKTPVVLTFDDGSKSNFYYDENGNIADDCVVGILNEFYEEHPDFGKNAIFYINGLPFGEEELIEKKLKYLIDNGYEIGNHTYGHEELWKLNADQIVECMGKNHNQVLNLVNYEMKHFAIPFGVRPKGDNEKLIFEGNYDGVDYNYESALNVGWNPVSSPFSNKFNKKSINRITCGEGDCRLNYWIDFFDKNDNLRYYSDGDKSTIVINEKDFESLKDEYKSLIDNVNEENNYKLFILKNN